MAKLDVAGGGYSPNAPPSIALQPVMDIVDRVVIGYEALPRPALGSDFFTVIESAIAISRQVTPALVYVHLPRRPLSASGVDVEALVDRLGANPAQIVWVVRDRARGGLAHEERSRLERLQEAGARLAVDVHAAPSLRYSLVAALRPDFVFLELGSSAWCADDDLTRSRIAATIAFVARLHGLLIARRVDSAAAAHAVAEVAIQYGVGRHLARPVVLDPGVARRGDVPVSRSWFRSREVRIISERGEALDKPFLLTLPQVRPGAQLDGTAVARLLSDAGRMLQADHDVEGVLRAAAGFFLQLIPAYRLAIFEADHPRHQMIPRVLAGRGAEGFANMDISMSSGITGWAFARGLPYRCGDSESHPAAAVIPESERIKESLLIIPLVAGDHRLGIIDLWRAGLDAFSEEDLERGALLGLVIAAAWRNAQAFSAIEHRALTDSLTGLYNRRWWGDMAPRLLAQTRRSGAGIGVLLMDLDHFKLVNDSVGHAAGDSVLRAVAAALQRAIREGDYAVRYGGEEFLVILPGCDPQGARKAAGAVHAALAALVQPNLKPGLITASIGVAAFPEHGQDLDEVAHAADQAMYDAKREGGDRIVVAPPLED